MSRVCQLCNRGPKMDATRSHSHIQSKNWTHVNLQTKKLAGLRISICTRCQRTLKK